MSQDQPELSIDDLPELCLSIITRKLPCKDRHMLSRASSHVYRMCTGDDCEPGLLGDFVLRYFKPREQSEWEIKEYGKHFVPASFTDRTTDTPTINIDITDDTQARLDEVLHYLGRHKNAFSKCTAHAPNLQTLVTSASVSQRVTGFDLDALSNNHMLSVSVSFPNVQVLTLQYVERSFDPTRLFPNLQELQVMCSDAISPLFSPGVVLPKLRALTLGKGSDWETYPLDELGRNLPSAAVSCPALTRLDLNCIYWDPVLPLTIPTIRFPTVKELVVGVMRSEYCMSGPITTLAGFGKAVDAVLSRLDLPAVETVVLRLNLSDYTPDLYPASFPISNFSLSDALHHLPTTTRDLRIEVSMISNGYMEVRRVDESPFSSDEWTSLRGPQTMSLRVSAPPDALAALTDLRSLTLDAVFNDELLGVSYLMVHVSVSFTYTIDLSGFQVPPHLRLVSDEYKQEHEFSNEALPDWPTRTITRASRAWQL